MSGNGDFKPEGMAMEEFNALWKRCYADMIPSKRLWNETILYHALLTYRINGQDVMV
jgi:hypothetical protein